MDSNLWRPGPIDTIARSLRGYKDRCRRIEWHTPGLLFRGALLRREAGESSQGLPVGLSAEVLLDQIEPVTFPEKVQAGRPQTHSASNICGCSENRHGPPPGVE